MKPTTEVWYAWRQLVEVDGKQRLLVPESDPRQYETPFDLLFETEQEAVDALIEHHTEDDDGELYLPGDWWMVKLTMEPIHFDADAVFQLGNL